MKLAAIFTDSMILQRDMPIRVFGTGQGCVEVTFLGETVTVSSKADNWCVTLQPHPAGGPYSMEISLNGQSITLSNILLGDVFLACGQSNMEMPLFKTVNGLEEATHCQNDRIRFFTVPRRFKADVDNYGWHFSSVYNTDMPWEPCREQTALFFTAIGYYFAKRMYQEVGVPIGIISCNWGGKKLKPSLNENIFITILRCRILSAIMTG